jgi:MFS family permease
MAAPTATVSTFAPLRVRPFRRVWGAALVSHIGTFLQLTAGPWLMNDLTRSPLLVSLVTTALTLPRLLLTLPAGVLSDTVDRRTLMLVGQLLSAVSVAVLAVLTFLDAVSPLSLLLLSFALGTGNAISLPSFQTLVPDLVDTPMRAQAITLNSAAFNVARALGPSLGGALVAAGLTGLAFSANAASFLAVVGVLLTFSRQEVEDPGRRGVWRSAALGVRYARFTQPIRVLLAMSALFALFAAPVQALLPSVVSDVLGLGAGGFGLLYGTFGAGALLGALTRERARARLHRWMLPGSVLGFGAASVAFGLSRVVPLSGVALGIAGLSWVWTLTTLNASIQLLAPRWVRGRVVSLYLLAIGLQPIGALIGGTLAEGIGPGVTVATLNAGVVLLGLAAFRLDLPVLGEIVEPSMPDNFAPPAHASRVPGTPVIVANTWEIDLADASEFTRVLRQLRRERFRSGAHRWSVYRDADRPGRITEFFTVHDWEEHLAQHHRLDAAAVTVIEHARSFDRAGGPITRHLAGLDILSHGAPPIEEQLLSAHELLHRTDGSVPLDGEPAGR